jgi:hypothetical protein
MSSFVSQGALVLMQCGHASQTPPAGGGRRGGVVMFSSRSRKRLREKLHRLRWPGAVLFLTLTFDPERFPKNWKYHLHRFIVGFLKAFPGWGIVWKLEFHQSGMPHFHLVLIPPAHIRVPFIKHQALAERWGLGFVWVERVWHRRIAQYLAKYVYKAGPYPSGRQGGRWEQVPSLDPTDISETVVQAGPGRFWGLRGHLEWAPVRMGAPVWAVRVALEVKRKLEETLGLRIRGWLTVFLDRQVT